MSLESRTMFDGFKAGTVMIKIVWNIPYTSSWIGGLNYFKNLATALLTLPERRIEPVVLGDIDSLPPPLCNLDSIPYPCEIEKYNLLEHTLKENNIQLFSHGWPLGLMSSIPSLCWIPDFQHKHLPHFFSKTEIAIRDSQFADVACEAQAVLLGSADAEKDFNHFFPKAIGKTHVLRFVAVPPCCETPEVVMACYEIAEPYFYIPNQIWSHKNHGLVLEALRIIQASGSCPLVISTGFTNDYRHPAYYNDLCKQVDEAGLSERFRFLGLIDINHVGTLMHSAIAIINPSRFEGWSTTVEEAKSLGKYILLSDISVHREQAPERGLYFDVDDPKALADLMRMALETYSPSKEEEAQQKAKAALPERMTDFARSYEEIVLNVLARESTVSNNISTSNEHSVWYEALRYRSETRINSIESRLNLESRLNKVEKDYNTLRWNLQHPLCWFIKKIKGKLGIRIKQQVIEEKNE